MAAKMNTAVAAGATAVATAAVGVAAKVAMSRRPSLPDDPDAYTRGVPATDQHDNPGFVRATFMGVSTLAFTDGDTTLMIDGFFSRPSTAKMLAGKIGPNHAAIDEGLRRADISKADAIFVAHSHYDHALDSPAVAWRTGAVMVGSESTLNIGRGYGLTEEQMRLAPLDEPMTFGNFRVTMTLTEHSPHGKFQGLIEKPLRAPARAKEYRMAECYSMHITHTGPDGKVRSLLVHPSAGFRPGCLKGYRAEVVFLGLTPLGKQSEEFRNDFWHETVETLRAKRVYPIHWDDFMLPLSEPLVPMPYVADDFGKMLEFLQQQRLNSGIEWFIPQAFQVFDPFGKRP